jgi:hypothetical protein
MHIVNNDFDSERFHVAESMALAVGRCCRLLDDSTHDTPQHVVSIEVSHRAKDARRASFRFQFSSLLVPGPSSAQTCPHIMY